MWQKVRIIARPDVGFCNPQLHNRCDFAGVDHVIGMTSNSKLAANAGVWKLLSSAGYRASDKPKKLYGEFAYRARTWRRKCRMIVKAECSSDR